MTPQPDEFGPAAVDMDESESEMAEMTGPARTCIVTRKVLDKGLMIRFVAGPSGDIVPDLKGDLPGRGFWVTADRKTLDEAVRTHIFTKVTKGKAKADLDNRERRVGGRPAGIICLGDLAGRALPADRGGLRRIGCGQRRHGKQRQAGREEHGLHGG